MNEGNLKWSSGGGAWSISDQSNEYNGNTISYAGLEGSSVSVEAVEAIVRWTVDSICS